VQCFSLFYSHMLGVGLARLSHGLAGLVLILKEDSKALFVILPSPLTLALDLPFSSTYKVLQQYFYSYFLL